MRRILVAAGVLLLVGTAGACSASNGGSSKSAADGQQAAHAGPAGGGAQRAGAGTVAIGSAAGTSAAAGSAAGGYAVAAGKNSPIHGSSSLGVLDDGSAKIRVAQMTVAIHGYQHVAAQADAADAIALQAGGEIDADNRSSGRYARAALQLRVPPDQLEPVLTALGKLGTEQSRSSSTTDVTEQVADVSSRLGSARESIARLRALYSSAHKVADVIAVETELSSREADLESLEAQQRSLSKQTAMASVALNLETAATHVAPVHKRPTSGGFLGGLRTGWHGFVAGAVWVAAALGALLPFLVVLFVLALAARLLGVRLPGLRLGRRAGAAPPAPVPSE